MQTHLPHRTHCPLPPPPGPPLSAPHTCPTPGHTHTCTWPCTNQSNISHLLLRFQLCPRGPFSGRRPYPRTSTFKTPSPLHSPFRLPGAHGSTRTPSAVSRPTTIAGIPHLGSTSHPSPRRILVPAHLPLYRRTVTYRRCLRCNTFTAPLHAFEGSAAHFLFTCTFAVHAWDVDAWTFLHAVCCFPPVCHRTYYLLPSVRFIPTTSTGDVAAGAAGGPRRFFKTACAHHSRAGRAFGLRVRRLRAAVARKHAARCYATAHARTQLFLFMNAALTPVAGRHTLPLRTRHTLHHTIHTLKKTPPALHLPQNTPPLP